MGKIIKVGYARLVKNGSSDDNYISYKELSYYTEKQLDSLKNLINKGGAKLYCACCPTDELELSITSNGVIRVKNNGLQDMHLDSCPKSIRYGAWLSENFKGTSFYKEGDKIIFNITLPGVSNGDSATSYGNASSSESDPKTSVLELARVLASVAWEKQTYSKKKAMSIAKRNNEPLEFKYKDIQKFGQLIYGVSNEIYVSVRGNLAVFSSLYYAPREFWSCYDYRRRFFFFAEIEKLSPYKAERRYQYVSVLMPSAKSATKTTIRIPTDKFDKIFEDIDLAEENTKKVLAGYINHSIFQDESGQSTEWATLLKGVGFYVSSNGLYAETPYVARLIDELCAVEELIIRRPYIPMENYNGFIPTLIVERYHHKDIIIDVCQSEKAYGKHSRGAGDNSEYDCIVLKDGESVNIVKKVSEIMKL